MESWEFFQLVFRYICQSVGYKGGRKLFGNNLEEESLLNIRVRRFCMTSHFWNKRSWWNALCHHAVTTVHLGSGGGGRKFLSAPVWAFCKTWDLSLEFPLQSSECILWLPFQHLEAVVKYIFNRNDNQIFKLLFHQERPWTLVSGLISHC